MNFLQIQEFRVALERQDYIIEDLIGEGLFARVHQGLRIGQCNEAVAIRKLKFVENSAFSETRLLKEAEELLNLVHENIVKTYSALLMEKGFVQEFCVK